MHNFKRMLSQTSGIQGNATFAPYLGIGALNGISQVVNSSEFGNLYDQYRINFVVWKFWLKIDPSAQAAGSASFPKLYWYRDYDDTTIPGSLNEIRENQRAKVVVMNPNRPVTIAFKPNTLQLVYQSPVASTYRPTWGQWIDAANLNTPHYGYKFGIDDLTNTNYRVDIEVTVYFSCRNPR